jgi:hypothetical protein
MGSFASEKARVIRALGVSNVIELGKHLSEVRSALSQKGGAHRGEWCAGLSENWDGVSTLRGATLMF